MAGLSRDFLLKKGAVTVASLRQKSFSIDFSSVDVTTDDSAGYQTLLAKAGKVAVSIDFGGVLGDEALFNIIMAGGDTQLYTDFTLVWESGATLACDFFLSNFGTSGGSSDGEVDFSGSLASSGIYTFTPAV